MMILLLLLLLMMLLLLLLLPSFPGCASDPRVSVYVAVKANKTF